MGRKPLPCPSLPSCNTISPTTCMSDSGGPRHGVIVLAAGASTRLGEAKQLLTIGGETLVHRTARLGLETGPVECVVVCGTDADKITASLADLACRNVYCDEPR